jgi:hypothetical protein
VEVGGGIIEHKRTCFLLPISRDLPDAKRLHAIASWTLFGIAAAIVLGIS